MIIESTHTRTESSSGGLGDPLQKSPLPVETRKKDQDITVARLKEENDELLSRLRCARDTVTALNNQVVNLEKEHKNDKNAWAKREGELMHEMQKLMAENSKLRRMHETKGQEIKELRENYDTMRKLYEFEESKSKRGAKMLQELQTKSVESRPLKCKTPSNSKMLTSRETIGAIQTAREMEPSTLESDESKRCVTVVPGGKSKHSANGSLKTPQVKPVTTESIFYNPISRFFA